MHRRDHGLPCRVNDPYLYLRSKSPLGYGQNLGLTSDRVTIQDSEGVSHTVEVTAATLYEAVAQGLAAIRGSE